MPDRDREVPDRSPLADSCPVGPVELFERTDFVAEGRVEPMARAHRHLDVEVNVVLSGRMTYSLGGRTVSAGAGRLLAFWAAVPHWLIVGDGGSRTEGTRCVWATVPLARIARWDLPHGGFDRLMAGGTLEGEAPAGATRWAGDAESGDPARRRAQGLELQAALLRATGRDALGGGTGAAARMCRFVAENLGRPLAAAEIAGAAGYHPTSAMRLFRRETGMTLGAYVAGQRLAAAQRLLLTTGLSVETVARRCGYGSASRFHAAFRKATETTPGGFRAGRADAPSLSGRAAGTGSG